MTDSLGRETVRIITSSPLLALQAIDAPEGVGRVEHDHEPDEEEGDVAEAAA